MIFLKISTNDFTDTGESIFEVYYKLEPRDLIIDGDLEVGPIMDKSTLDDLTEMVRI
jgi:hypothetical protein